MSLIWSYIWQENRKCSSVSTSFCGQWAHSLSSLESQVCLRRPFSIARLHSLYIVKAFLNFVSVTVVNCSDTTLCLGPNSILVCLVFLVNVLSLASKNKCWNMEKQSDIDINDWVTFVPSQNPRSWSGRHEAGSWITYLMASAPQRRSEQSDSTVFLTWSSPNSCQRCVCVCVWVCVCEYLCEKWIR